MVRQLRHEEIAELLGAYALDAVDADEAQAVEAHLATCPRCRDEVRDHREVASLLAYGGTAAPTGLWDKLVAALDEPTAPSDAPVLAPVTPISAAATRSSGPSSTTRRRGARMAAAAVLLLLLGAVGGLWLKVDDVTHRVERGQSDAALSQIAAAASTTPGARRVQLATTDKTVLADAVLTPDGSSYLYNVRLPALRPERAYQLWAIVGNGDKRSVGVLGSSPRVAAFHVPTGTVVALAITDEVATGATAPTRQAVVYGLLSA